MNLTCLLILVLADFLIALLMLPLFDWSVACSQYNNSWVYCGLHISEHHFISQNRSKTFLWSSSFR